MITVVEFQRSECHGSCAVEPTTRSKQVLEQTRTRQRSGETALMTGDDSMERSSQPAWRSTDHGSSSPSDYPAGLSKLSVLAFLIVISYPRLCRFLECGVGGEGPRSRKGERDARGGSVNEPQLYSTLTGSGLVVFSELVLFRAGPPQILYHRYRWDV
jgi:hypothetical protein